MPPLPPLMIGRCLNCGNRRDLEACSNCGLTRQEDVQVHNELRCIIDSTLSHLDAARAASRQGRRLLAVKLATAASASNENGQGEVARALRIWLLSAIGEPQHAREDARVWVEGTQDASAIAWASYGQQLQAANAYGAAADAYEKALKKNPKQYNIRARRSQLLLELRRGGQALEEAVRVLSTPDVDEQTVAIASKVAERLCDAFEDDRQDEEISRLLDYSADYVDRSPALLAHRARLLASTGDLAGARRDLRRARRLNPELEIYERVERAMRPNRGWFSW